MDENHILLLNVVYHLRLIQHDLHYFFAAEVQTELIKKLMQSKLDKKTLN